MGLNKKKTFVRKPSDKQLYKWSPPVNVKRATKTITNGRGLFCNAIAFSNGEDWITTYVHELSSDSKGLQHKYAYVACDYVE